MNAMGETYCLIIRRWARWAPMALLWRIVGHIPAWACRLTPCTMGWRVSAARWWLRPLPVATRHWLGYHLPRWMVEKNISPDCANCRRFIRESHCGG